MHAKGLLYTCSLTLFTTMLTLSASAQTNSDRSKHESLSRKHNVLHSTHEVKRMHSNEMSLRLKENKDLTFYHQNQKNTSLERKRNHLKYKEEVTLLKKDAIEGNIRVKNK